MKILGIKTSHDGALALIDNGRLIFSYEMEKLNNNNRIEVFKLSLGEIEKILNDFGYSLYSLDCISVDGWLTDKKSVLLQEQEDEFSFFSTDVLLKHTVVDIKISKHGKLVDKEENILKPVEGEVSSLGLSYVSYMHLSGHAFGAYCTSEFAKKRQDSYILVWDGGMAPQLFYFYAMEKKVVNYGPLLTVFGWVYPRLSFEFSPFDKIKGDELASGKIMAYVALGKLNEELMDWFFALYRELESNIIANITIKNINWVTNQFIIRSANYFAGSGLSSEDMLYTFHVFLERLLIGALKDRIDELPHPKDNLCFAGGCALSIKWNSKLRESGIFKNMWVPPFPNDSGNAIGAACCSMIDKSDVIALDWNVYTGPRIVESSELKDTYAARPFSIKELAGLLVEKDEPVVVISDRAELGPRALGNRSIISSATNVRMKDLLNKIKGREFYRPVAPICLAADAPRIFSPGTRDPYMLYEHMVKDEWKHRVPAIVHLDGSARLQTVDREENEVIYELLTCYHELTNIPVLCNTSANLKGKGFFPDVKSAIEWDSVNYIWSNNILYERKEKLALFDSP